MIEQSVFEWDQWNIQKNEIKHGVSSLEAESSFYDKDYLLFEDFKHSNAELRFILLGKSIENRILMVGFTFRTNLIRVITARPVSKNERAIYESKTNKNE